MANGSNSPIFNPPMNRITENDPQVVRIDQTKTDWGFRKSQAPPQANIFPLANLPNGK